MRMAVFVKLVMAVLVVGASIEADAKDLVFPFRRATAGVLLVEATVNGSRGVFIFDTGATRTLVAADRIGVPAAKLPPAVRRSGPGIRSSGITRQVDLRLGDRSFCALPVVAVDLGDFQSVFGPTVWGVLGQDLMTGFARVEIDYRRGEIILSD